MNILRNFKNFLICFAIIFCVSFIYYLGKIVYMYHGVPGTTFVRYVFLMMLFMRDYFFPLSIIASMLSLLFISGTVRFSGGISIVATLLIISFTFVLYPIAVRYISYPRNYDLLPKLPDITHLSLSAGSIQTFGDNYVYVENIDKDGNYKNILAANSKLNERNLSIASLAVEDRQNITLNSPIVLTNQIEHVVAKADIEKPNKKTINVLEVFFAVPLLPYLNSLFTYFTSVRIPYYIYIILFMSLFLFLMGVYILGSAFSVEAYKYHNMLSAFLIYIAIIIYSFFIFYRLDALYGLENIFTSLGYLRLSIIILALSVFINILAFAFSRIFKFDKYY